MENEEMEIAVIDSYLQNIWLKGDERKEGRSQKNRSKWVYENMCFRWENSEHGNDGRDPLRGRAQTQECQVPEELGEAMTSSNYFSFNSQSNNQRQYFRRGFLLDK